MNPAPFYNRLDYQERQTIAIGLEQGLSLRAKGRVLNRSAAIISWEVSRNSEGRRLQLPLCPAAPGAKRSPRQSSAQAGGGQRFV